MPLQSRLVNFSSILDRNLVRSSFLTFAVLLLGVATHGVCSGDEKNSTRIMDEEEIAQRSFRVDCADILPGKVERDSVWIRFVNDTDDIKNKNFPKVAKPACIASIGAARLLPPGKRASFCPGFSKIPDEKKPPCMPFMLATKVLGTEKQALYFDKPVDHIRIGSGLVSAPEGSPGIPAEEVAWVIAHELGHYNYGHSDKKRYMPLANVMAGAVPSIMLGAAGIGNMVGPRKMKGALQLLGAFSIASAAYCQFYWYDKYAESQADEFGVKALVAYGYSLADAKKYAVSVLASNRQDSSTCLRFLKSNPNVDHPDTKTRARDIDAIAE